MTGTEIQQSSSSHLMSSLTAHHEGNFLHTWCIILLLQCSHAGRWWAVDSKVGGSVAILGMTGHTTQSTILS